MVTSNAGNLNCSSDDQDTDDYDLSYHLPSRPQAPTNAQLLTTSLAWAVATSRKLCAL